jgi:hypothetical protein
VSRTKVRKRSQRTTRAKPAKSGGPRLSAPAWRRLWGLVAFLAVAGSLTWGLHYLDGYVQGLRAGVPCELEWVNLPAWLTTAEGSGVLDQIAASVRAAVPEDNLNDPELCRRVAEGLQASPWVRAVERVSKRADGTIRVQASYRRPFAYVETFGRAYRIDSEGVRLPDPVGQNGRQAPLYVEYVNDRYWEKWLRVVGVESAVPDVGQPWESKDLAAGLKLARFLGTLCARSTSAT